jgi:hypothetical protein
VLSLLLGAMGDFGGVLRNGTLHRERRREREGKGGKECVSCTQQLWSSPHV